MILGAALLVCVAIRGLEVIGLHAWPGLLAGCISCGRCQAEVNPSEGKVFWSHSPGRIAGDVRALPTPRGGLLRYSDHLCLAVGLEIVD